MSDFKKWFQEIDNKIIFKKDLGVMYLPEEFFRRGISSIEGEDVETFGIFRMRVYDDFTDEDEGYTELDFSIPTVIRLTPTTITEKIMDEIDDDGNLYKEKYKKLIFDRDSVMIKSTMTIQRATNVVAFMTLLLGGKMPRMIPYDKITSFWIECNKLNGVNLDSPYSLFDLIIRILCRDPNNTSILFSDSMNKNPSIARDSYDMIRMTDIPKYTGAFPALTSGDPSTAISKSIGDQRLNKGNAPTPLEELLS